MKKNITTEDDIKRKLIEIQKIIGEPIDVNVGVENIKGKNNIKILNIATKTGLSSLVNPLTKLILPLQQLGGQTAKEPTEVKKHRIEYVG